VWGLLKRTLRRGRPVGTRPSVEDVFRRPGPEQGLGFADSRLSPLSAMVCRIPNLREGVLSAKVRLLRHPSLSARLGSTKSPTPAASSSHR
jgi:hypothetical protein